MILGNVCTRACRFCAVRTGNPQGKTEVDEPERVALAVKELGVSYLVLTSVDRDDLADFGAGHFARTVQVVKERNPGVKVEVLVPDFGGQEDLIAAVLAAGPDVFGHNLETVERLTPLVRDRRAGYRLSLTVLEKAKKIAPAVITKSGLMLGLGETLTEVFATLGDLRAVGCDVVTVGQYLQPSRGCLDVVRFWTPAEFAEIKARAEVMGFRQVQAGPLVRSSYRAAGD